MTLLKTIVIGIVSVISIFLFNKSVNIGIVSVLYRLYRYDVHENDNYRYRICIVSIISIFFFNNTIIIGIVSVSYRLYRYSILTYRYYRIAKNNETHPYYLFTWKWAAGNHFCASRSFVALTLYVHARTVNLGR